jgi:MoaA/NifB/PqqE/SkfB family radical SAM enzyme
VLELWLEVEARCNLRCRFCYNPWRDGSEAEPNALATPQLLEQLSLLLASVPTHHVTISGGEPLLRRDLESVLRFFQERGIAIVLTTNGTLLTRARIAQLRDWGVGTFQVPLHSTRARVHDYLSGRQCWRRTLRALVELREAGAEVGVVFVSTRINVADFPRVVDVVGTLGIHDVIYNQLIASGSAATNIATLGIPSAQESFDAILSADRCASKLGMCVHLGVPIGIEAAQRALLSTVRYSSCPVGVGQHRWTVGPNGAVRRCSHGANAEGFLDGTGRDVVANEVHRTPLSESKDSPCQLSVPGSLVNLGRRAPQMNAEQRAGRP